MREDHARCIHFYRFPHNFTRMHLNVTQRARKETAMFQHPISVIDKDHYKDLAFNIS